jgi:hypothetical protein
MVTVRLNKGFVAVVIAGLSRCATQLGVVAVVTDRCSPNPGGCGSRRRL